MSIINLLFLISVSVGNALDYSCLHADSWVINNAHYNSIFSTVTDVQSSYYFNTTTSRRRLSTASERKHLLATPPPKPAPPTSGGGGPSGGGGGTAPSYSPVLTEGWIAKFTGIPNYDHYFSSAEITKLNSRPKKSTDFNSGSATTATAGEYVVFGDDINYKSTACTDGYWPPGPVCPAAYSGSQAFSVQPAPEMTTGGCYIGGQVGYFVNGVPFWSWTDANTYNSAGVWSNLAGSLEQYDMDVCGGHAANGVYHHHFYSPCLGTVLGDDGSAHSPLHGFAYDSYPVYGPYHSSGVLAVSCWQKRDYSSSATGCSDHTRSCVLKDEFDYTKGTSSATSGPSLTGTVSSLSGNSISAASGIYYEDYFWNSTCSALGNQHLDAHNGHSHDSYGYHYHATIDSSGTPQFPYIVGPKYYGCVKGNVCNPAKTGTGTSASICGTSDGINPKLSSCKASNGSPTIAPTTSKPALSPTVKPTTRSPTMKPTTLSPTVKATTLHPSMKPSTVTPTIQPTSSHPSAIPSTAEPTLTLTPTEVPTTSQPSLTFTPSTEPSMLPSESPSLIPSVVPSLDGTTPAPSNAPQEPPTAAPVRIDYEEIHENSWAVDDPHFNNIFKCNTGISASGYVDESRRLSADSETHSNGLRGLESVFKAGNLSPSSRSLAGPMPAPPGNGPPQQQPPTQENGGGHTGGPPPTNTVGWLVEFSGIPDYGHDFTTAEISRLNSRPNAYIDFRSNNVTSAVADEYIEFGTDIGYAYDSCDNGYWPPGPGCPAAYNGSYIFSLTPAPEVSDDGCYIGGTVGYLVNGVPFWSWSDARSYNDEAIWNDLAGAFEARYDMDVCLGHAANNIYHHHTYSPCLAVNVGDVGDSHSPVYGFAYDSYPIHGPYQSNGELAVSCWQTRNYASDSPTGCSDGDRSCQLKDPFDYTKGVQSVTSGPSISSTLPERNPLAAISGIYFEDYFWNSTCSELGGPHLDSHNGHKHGTIGYHYHMTVDSDMEPVFPYTVGPKYYGCVSGSTCYSYYTKQEGDSESQCGTSEATSVGSPTKAPTTSSSSTTLTTGAIIGIAVGGGVVLLLIIVGAFCVYYPQSGAKIHGK